MSKLPCLGHNWPFPEVNGERTSESLEAISAPPEPRQSLYEQVMSDPDIEEAPL